MLVDARTHPGGTFVVAQRLHYTYTASVRRLRHRLMVVPRATHGDQYCDQWELKVSGATVQRRESLDRFGNRTIEVGAPVVRSEIEFIMWAVVGRRNPNGPVAPVPMGPGEDAGMARPTALTLASPALARASVELADVAVDRLDFAERACAWAHRALTYKYGVTSVSTSAHEALAGGFGVCQDYAHIMLALCRAVGVPARYVSGHLLGEGGSHAWVEVIVDPGSAPGIEGCVAVAFDPTHDRRPGPAYITVAVGRDYADVAPTSGYFDGHAQGKLSVRKNVAPIGSPSGDLTPVLAALASR